MKKYSKIQIQILTLYREFLRATKNKPELSDYVRQEFRKNAVIPKTSVLIIEQMYRRGQRQLQMLRRKDVDGAGVFTKDTKFVAQTSNGTQVYFRPLSAVAAAARNENETVERKADIYERVVQSFPAGIEMAFAYGSGVFQQSGQNMAQNMLDFIFVVNDSSIWHQKNLQLYPQHYSALAKLGSKTVASIQDNYAAGMYFNTLVPFEDRTIKYGIINKDRLLRDLIDWDSLYISGRLHKPVKMIQHPSCPSITKALDTNLQSAFHTALLLLPKSFTMEKLFITITSLSYNGDFRMIFGEDKGKVKKIVRPNIEHFFRLYSPLIKNDEHIHWNKTSLTYEQDVSSSITLSRLNNLPQNAVIGLQKSFKFLSAGEDDQNERKMFLDLIAKDERMEMHIANSLKGIVFNSSWRQSLKGILTAGIVKSTQYSSKKVQKMRNSSNKG